VEELLESVPHTVPPPAPEPVDKAQLRQALADLEGAKARVERDAERAREEAKASVVLGMLPILDNLDRSIAAADSSPDRALLEGIQLVRSQFEDALARYGLERIETAGAPFDPSVHEAVGMVEVVDPTEDGTVIDEWQRGYRFGGRVVRAPKVRVGRLAQANRG
jgi:molecular chaperone GrpE (heat shock protein)